MKGDHAFRKKPKGSINGGYARPRVQIGFTPDVLRAITQRAKQNKRSFAAEVRTLIEYALAQGGPVDTPAVPV